MVAVPSTVAHVAGFLGLLAFAGLTVFATTLGALEGLTRMNHSFRALKLIATIDSFIPTQLVQVIEANLSQATPSQKAQIIVVSFCVNAGLFLRSAKSQSFGQFWRNTLYFFVLLQLDLSILVTIVHRKKFLRLLNEKVAFSGFFAMLDSEQNEAGNSRIKNVREAISHSFQCALSVSSTQLPSKPTSILLNKDNLLSSDPFHKCDALSDVVERFFVGEEYRGIFEDEDFTEIAGKGFGWLLTKEEIDNLLLVQFMQRTRSNNMLLATFDPDRPEHRLKFMSPIAHSFYFAVGFLQFVNYLISFGFRPKWFGVGLQVSISWPWWSKQLRDISALDEPILSKLGEPSRVRSGSTEFDLSDSMTWLHVLKQILTQSNLMMNPLSIIDQNGESFGAATVPLLNQLCADCFKDSKKLDENHENFPRQICLLVMKKMYEQVLGCYVWTVDDIPRVYMSIGPFRFRIRSEIDIKEVFDFVTNGGATKSEIKPGRTEIFDWQVDQMISGFAEAHELDG